MRPRPFRDAALRFLIWRVGAPLNWECTASEIAEQAEIPVKEVRRICRKYGYELERKSHPTRVQAIDEYFRTANLY